jgi:lysophospholipase L1-like esterase
MPCCGTYPKGTVQMRTWNGTRRFVLIVAAVATGAMATVAQPARADTARPPAIVAIGDSFAAGEAAGNYDPATDRPGNFCHRSRAAEIETAAIDGVATRINLGCTGATTENVRLGGAARFGEAPQAERLRAIARDYQVRLVTVSVGANDIPFLNLVLSCIQAYFLLGPRCQDAWATKLPAALAAMAPRIGRVLGDVRAVLRDAGYADGDYDLVLQSYSSPVTDDGRYTVSKAVQGCPVRTDDARWTRERAAPRIAATLAEVAAAAGARFLDLAPGMRGHEVCARGVTHAQEWSRGINISLAQLRNGVGENLVQHSMHPNALGYGQFARCLTAFHVASVRTARCLPDADGNLVPVAGAPAATDTGPQAVVPEAPPES